MRYHISTKRVPFTKNLNPPLPFPYSRNPRHPSIIHQGHRPHIRLPSLQQISSRAGNDQDRKHEDSPIEILQGDRGGAGPEAPEKDKDGVDQTDAVDGDAEAAEAPSGFGEEFRVLDAAVEDAGDGDDVREHEGGELKGDDGVEGGGGADVDEGEDYGHSRGDGYGVGGDVEFGVNLYQGD